MLNFLLSENILAVAPICGLFTTHMLLSLKNNILDPTAHKLFPTNFFGDCTDSSKSNANINWKIFLKEFVLWIIIMTIFYIIWAKLLKKSQH
jgi:large-conductance mechanosensitive channel